MSVKGNYFETLSFVEFSFENTYKNRTKRVSYRQLFEVFGLVYTSKRHAVTWTLSQCRKMFFCSFPQTPDVLITLKFLMKSSCFVGACFKFYFFI